MPVRVELQGRALELPFSRALADDLRRFARFDPAARAWRADHVPCWFARRWGLPRDGCVDGRWWRGHAYIWELSEGEVRRTCYTVARWRRVPCGEYCAERCAGARDPGACEERCKERCEEEGWRPAERAEEAVCLARRTGRGDWQVPRGLVPLLGRRMPRFADLGHAAMHPDLRDYQVDVLYSAWSQLERCGAATVQMATGAGKSYLAGYLARLLAERGYRVFLTALQLDLVHQLEDFARRWGAPMNRVHAVTVQALYRRLAGRSAADDAEGEDAEVVRAYADEQRIDDGLARLFEGGERVAVIMDEAHHVPARTVREVMGRAGGGWALRVGLTATPFRNDGRDLEIYAYAGAVVEPRITSSFLIERGHAVPVEIRVVRAPRCVDFEPRGPEGWAREVEALVECEERNRLVAELALRAERPALVVTARVRHAELLGRMLGEAGLRAEVATGAVKGETRRRIYDALRRGEIDAIAATTLADEGLDLPPLRTLIIALAGRSRTRALQRIGRLVRPWPGKAAAVAYELEDPAGFSREHLRERLRLYASEPAWRVVRGWRP
jgi:superfamily II DNA or RNA helicase